MDSTLILAFTFFTLGLTYFGLTTRVKLISMIAVVPCIVLAIELNSLMSLALVALAIFNGAYFVMEFRS